MPAPRVDAITLLDADKRVNARMTSPACPRYKLVVVGFTAAIDLYGQSLRAKATAKDPQWMLTGSYLPGDFGFDPLELYPKDQNGRKRMQLAEISFPHPSQRHLVFPASS